jgi:hypothetical protein
MSKLCRRSVLVGAALALSTAGAITARAAKDDTMIAAMPPDYFWALIEKTLTFKNNQAKQADALRQALVALPPADIEAFDIAFRTETIRAYSWDLWGAAYVIHGGASDDGFHYFCSWLIAQGRTIFEQALADPDSLADLIPKDAREVGVFGLEFEEFAYVAADAWRKVTGKDDRNFAKGGPVFPEKPTGTPFEEDEAYLAKRYPKLWARFGDNPLG